VFLRYALTGLPVELDPAGPDVLYTLILLYEAFAAVKIQVEVFRDVMPCSVVVRYQVS